MSTGKLIFLKIAPNNSSPAKGRWPKGRRGFTAIGRLSASLLIPPPPAGTPPWQGESF